MSAPTTTRPQGPGAATVRPVVRPSSALLQRRVRDLHTYLGMLFAPSLLFFAVTGALQLYNLHEVRPGRSFEPPALFQELGMVHKDQVFRMPRRRAPPQEPAGAAASPPNPVPPAPEAPRGTEWGTQILKLFFLSAALALITSTCLGVWLGLKSSRHRLVSVALLFVGVLVPTLLLAI